MIVDHVDGGIDSVERGADGVRGSSNSGSSSSDSSSRSALTVHSEATKARQAVGWSVFLVVLVVVMMVGSG